MWVPKKKKHRNFARKKHIVNTIKKSIFPKCLKSNKSEWEGSHLTIPWDEASKPRKFRWFKPRLTQGSYKITLNIRLAYRSSAHIFLTTWRILGKNFPKKKNILFVDDSKSQETPENPQPKIQGYEIDTLLHDFASEMLRCFGGSICLGECILNKLGNGWVSSLQVFSLESWEPTTFMFTGT